MFGLKFNINTSFSSGKSQRAYSREDDGGVVIQKTTRGPKGKAQTDISLTLAKPSQDQWDHNMLINAWQIQVNNLDTVAIDPADRRAAVELLVKTKGRAKLKVITREGAGQENQEHTLRHHF